MKNEPVPPLDLSYEPVTSLGPPELNPSFPKLPIRIDRKALDEVHHNPWIKPPSYYYPIEGLIP